MANRHRGEVALGDHTLVFSTNALCDLEGELSPLGIDLDGLDEALKARGSRKLTVLRALIWAGLQERHEGLTRKDAGRIMDEVGHRAAGAAVTRALTEAFPAASGQSAARPQKPAEAA